MPEIIVTIWRQTPGFSSSFILHPSSFPQKSPVKPAFFTPRAPRPAPLEKCSKIFQKKVDTPLAFWDIVTTHGK
jgi:hypothetical protein